MSQIRWGIIATGSIARSFAGDLTLVDDAELVGVGSRSYASAQQFAAEYGASRAYGSYAEVAQDPDIDVVYVATPHALHLDNATMCLRAGRAVLCEKPVTLTARTAALLIQEARSRGHFFMEAMWMRCNPHIRVIQSLVADGVIGEVRAVSADFGSIAAGQDKARLIDPALGASTVLDTGIYPLTLASLLLGEPRQIRSIGTLSPLGTDEACVSLLSYDSGAVATLTCTSLASTPGRAYVAGTAGHIEIGPPFYAPDYFTVSTEAGVETVRHDVVGVGYTAEIEEVHRCLRAGLTESPLVPLDDTLAVMGQLDTIRAQIGSVLPGDEES